MITTTERVPVNVMIGRIIHENLVRDGNERMVFAVMSEDELGDRWLNLVDDDANCRHDLLRILINFLRETLVKVQDSSPMSDVYETMWVEILSTVDAIHEIAI